MCLPLSGTSQQKSYQTDQLEHLWSASHNPDLMLWPSQFIFLMAWWHTTSFRSWFITTNSIIKFRYVNRLLNGKLWKKKYYFYTKNPIDLIYLREYLFLQDSKKMFQSLVSLVIHHSVMPECLPCPLILSHSDIGSDDENHVNKQLSTSCQWVSVKID